MSAPLSEAPVFAPSGAVVRCGRHGSPVIPITGNYTGVIALSAAGAADPYAAVPPGELGYYPNVPFGVEGYEGAKHQYWTADSTHGDMVVNGGDSSGNSNQDTFAYNPATRVFTKILGNNDVGAFAFDRSIIHETSSDLTFVGGSGYVNGIYPDPTGVTGVPLIGGTGTQASAWIQVVGGAVTFIPYQTGLLTHSGYGYTVGDVLTVNSADVGGSGDGFSVTVKAVTAAGTPSSVIAPIGRCLPGIRHDPTRNVIWLEGGTTRPRTWAGNMKRGGLWALNRDSTPPVWTHQGPGALEAFGGNAEAAYSTGMFYDLGGDALYAMVGGSRMYKYPLAGITIDGVSRNLWQRFNTILHPGYGYGCYDSLRRRILYFNELTTITYAWHCATDTEESLGPTGFPQTYVDTHMAYDTSLDRVVLWAAANDYTGAKGLRGMYWMDPSGAWTAFTPDGDKLFEDDIYHAQNTGDYDPVTKCIVMQVANQDRGDWNFLNSRSSIHHLYSPSVSPAYPAWRRAMTAGAWGPVGTSTLAAINPANNPSINADYPARPVWERYSDGGYSSSHQIISPWCGGCYDRATDTLWLPNQGGHGDYGGNESYKFLLSSDSPSWTMPLPPSGSKPRIDIEGIPVGATPLGNSFLLDDGSAAETSGMYADGRPRSTHTYNKPVYVPGVGPVIPVLGGSFHGASAQAVNCTWRLNEAVSDWELKASGIPSWSGLAASMSGACYHAATNSIYHIGSGTSRLCRLSIDSWTWSNPGTSSKLEGGDNKLISTPEFPESIFQLSAAGLRVWNVANGTFTLPSITGSGFDLTAGSFSFGADWCDALGCIVIWRGISGSTGQLFTLTPAGAASDPWIWGEIATTGTPPVADARGTYGRFCYSPKLNGFLVLSAKTTPVWFFPLD